MNDGSTLCIDDCEKYRMVEELQPRKELRYKRIRWTVSRWVGRSSSTATGYPSQSRGDRVLHESEIERALSESSKDSRSTLEAVLRFLKIKSIWRLVL